MSVLCAHMAVGLDDRVTGSDEQSVNLDVLQPTARKKQRHEVASETGSSGENVLMISD